MDMSITGLAKILFGDTKQLEGNPLEVLKKNRKKTLSSEPTKFPRKETKMKPTEKAEDIFKKMYGVRSSSASELTKHFAKQSALIAIDEVMLEQCKSSEKKDAKYQDERLMYWQEVKKEIENL